MSTPLLLAAACDGAAGATDEAVYDDDEEAEAAGGGGAAAPSATNCARPARAMSSSRDAAAIATGAVAALPPAWERGRERGVRER
jgi:hypothetical protein